MTPHSPHKNTKLWRRGDVLVPTPSLKEQLCLKRDALLAPLGVRKSSLNNQCDIFLEIYRYHDDFKSPDLPDASPGIMIGSSEVSREDKSRSIMGWA
jgi:hypothetical protein